MSENNRWSEPSGNKDTGNSQWCNNHFRLSFCKTNVCDGLTNWVFRKPSSRIQKFSGLFERLLGVSPMKVLVLPIGIAGTTVAVV